MWKCGGPNYNSNSVHLVCWIESERWHQPHSSDYILIRDLWNVVGLLPTWGLISSYHVWPNVSVERCISWGMSVYRKRYCFSLVCTHRFLFLWGKGIYTKGTPNFRGKVEIRCVCFIHFTFIFIDVKGMMS